MSGPTRSIEATGTPRPSAAIWARIVFEPWPMSVAPENSTTVPSARRPTSMSEGLGSDVLPMPYHIAATPTPRRIGLPPAPSLCAAAAARIADQGSRSASRQAGRPALASSSWDVAVSEPTRSALRKRNSRGSMPS